MESEEERAEETAVRLDAVGRQILCAARDELYLGMRFLDVALSSFQYVMDGAVSPFGTDGAVIYFQPIELGNMYRQNRVVVNRGYLHMVMHCIFRHIWKEDGGYPYWDLCCDIAAEHIIDGLFHRSVRFSRSMRRRDVYRRLESQGKVLNAENVCHMLTEWNLPEAQMKKLSAEFYVDDHKYWESRKKPDQNPDPQINHRWQEISEKMETDLDTFSKEASEQSGELLDQIKVENKEKYDYKEFLRKFSVLREETAVDTDTFDYSFYSYGLRLYGNMPLIEPVETREVKKIAEFAVVIDTSMSCSGDLVRKFLEETYDVLSESESFFRKVNIHIIQCDEEVQNDQQITCEKDLKQYMENLTLYGNGGTNFCPAFSYVDELKAAGEFRNLQGMIYFTDGYGIYPQKKPAYQTAFVFMRKDYQDTDVPSWAMKLILEEKDLEEENQSKTAGGKI